MESPHSRRSQFFGFRAVRVLSLVPVVAISACISTPPYIGFDSGPALQGGLVQPGGSYEAETDRGERRGFQVFENDLELWRGGNRIVFTDVVPEGGLRFSEDPSTGSIRFTLTGGRIAAWLGASVYVDGTAYELDDRGRRVALAELPAAGLLRGHLDRGDSFFRQRVWMAANGAHLELERATFKLIVRDVVPIGGIDFIVRDFDTPHVEFLLEDGSSAIWVRDRVISDLGPITADD